MIDDIDELLSEGCPCCITHPRSIPTPFPTLKKETSKPTPKPSKKPTKNPTPAPSLLPTRNPAPRPTKSPTSSKPTFQPTTIDPTSSPTPAPEEEEFLAFGSICDDEEPPPTTTTTSKKPCADLENDDIGTPYPTEATSISGETLDGEANLAKERSTPEMHSAPIQTKEPPPSPPDMHSDSPYYAIDEDIFQFLSL